MPTILSDKPDFRQALITLAFWTALIAGGAFLPAERAWGINHWAFASLTTRAAILCGGTAAIIYLFVRRSERRVFPWLESQYGGMIVVMAVGILSAVMYSREGLLGDGTLRAKDALQQTSVLASEILPTLAATAAAQLLPGQWAVDGYTILRSISILSGMLMVALLWNLIPKATGRTSHSLIVWILTFGTVRLLAGYVETYTTAFAFFAIWTIAAWGYFSRRMRSEWMVASWALAMVSHVTAVFLLPATVWLLCRERPITRARFIYCSAAGSLASGILVAFYVGQVNISGVSTGHFFVTLLPESPNSYGLFSSAHILDLLNHWALIAPAAISAGVAYVFGRPRGGDRDIGTTTGQWNGDSGVSFWLLAAGLPAVMAFVIDPKLGWARDWDLYALLYSPALVGIALRMDQLTGLFRRAALSVAVLSSALWLSFSVDGEAEVRRFEALLELDPSRSDYGHEILAQRYRHEGNTEGALRHYRAALFVSENLRYRMNIAAAYAQLRKYDDAERWYRGVIGRDSSSAAAFHGLSLVLSECGRWAEALEWAQRAHILEPGNPEYLFRYASALLGLERPQEALPYLEASVRRLPNDAPVHNALAVCYLDLGRLNEADSLIQAALRFGPDEAMIWLNASRIAFARGDYSGATDRLSQYRLRTPEGQWVPAAVMMQDSLEQMMGLKR